MLLVHQLLAGCAASATGRVLLLAGRAVSGTGRGVLLGGRVVLAAGGVRITSPSVLGRHLFRRRNRNWVRFSLFLPDSPPKAAPDSENDQYCQR